MITQALNSPTVSGRGLVDVSHKEKLNEGPLAWALPGAAPTIAPLHARPRSP
jgi:hypothetical protein